MPHLMTINIGPVQSFIEAARRTRDLWYGSWLVSELSKTALKVVLDNKGILISPVVTFDKTNDKNYLSVNRILAIVDNPAQIGEALAGTKEQAGALENFLVRQWHEVCRQIADVKEDESFEPQIWNWLDKDAQPEAQIRDLVECQWVAVPYVDNKYKECRDQSEALLAARKNTRNFQQVSWGRYKAKSSLDGVRESVINENLFPGEGATPQNRTSKSNMLYRHFRAGPAERLSAVDLIKRLGNEEQFDRIPSTSHIAARPFLKLLDEHSAQVRPLVQNLREQLDSLIEVDTIKLDTVKDEKFHSASLGNLDSAALYENRLQVQAEERGVSSDRVDAAKQVLRRFYRDLKKIDATLKEPSPYYALLLADGDNMGKAIDAQTKIDEHQKLAKTLDEFAIAAKSIVESEFAGALIYAGGDDVMAFLPLNTVFDCAQKLATVFKSTLEAALAGTSGEATVKKPLVIPTLSCGITIAHHLEPLGDVLRLTRAAERKAKDIEGKAAVAITLSKRSGIDRTIAGRWEDGFVERFTTFYKLFEKDEIPHGVAYELSALYQRLNIPAHWQPTKNQTDQLRNAMISEAGRIFDRKRDRTGVAASKTLDRTKFETYLKSAPSIQSIAYELIVAETLASAGKRSN